MKMKIALILVFTLTGCMFQPKAYDLRFTKTEKMTPKKVTQLQEDSGVLKFQDQVMSIEF